ncbi:MAG TPA: hypothetical protein VJ984_00295 [Xanthomonadales bacterium]|nr:hypothetical protein [Xanthomonadales bacterium]
MADKSNTWGDALGSEITPEWNNPDHRAFDFWVGEWEMTWRGRQPDNFHFDEDGSVTRQRVFPILGGKALVELAWAIDANADEPSQRGFSIRYYDEKREKWVMAQNWPGPGNPGYAFLDQLIGFKDFNRFSMYSAIRRPQQDGSYQYGHRRYNFADISDGSFRWDGSNTYDDGQTYMTWNVVDATRIRPLDQFGAAGTSWPGYIGGQLCTDEPNGAYDHIEGSWAGTLEEPGNSKKVTMNAGRLLDGCAVALAVNIEGGRQIFSTLSFEPRSGNWIMFTLDNRPGMGHVYFWSPDAGEGATFHQAPGLSIKNDQELYVLDENFDATAARTRLIWQKVESDRIVIERQHRSDEGSNWETGATYSLNRVGGE